MDYMALLVVIGVFIFWASLKSLSRTVDNGINAVEILSEDLPAQAKHYKDTQSRFRKEAEQSGASAGGANVAGDV